MKKDYSIKEKQRDNKNRNIQIYCMTAAVILLMGYAGCNAMVKKDKKESNVTRKDLFGISNKYNYLDKSNYWYTKDIVIPSDKYQIKISKEKIRVLK